jgi:large subunit ribosomal protein L25
LPEYIEFDMEPVIAGQIIHISDLVLPEGVESVALSHGEDYDASVASVQMPRGGSDEEDEAEAAAEDSADADAEDEGDSED